jgi:tetratricopeptide (TPR) repeat protein
MVSCSVLKKTTNHENEDHSDYSSVHVQLSDEESRKFNYYFFEGNRYKAINEPNKSFMYFAEAFKIDSTCSACAYELSRLLLANKSFEEAEHLMEKAVRFSPDNHYYIILLSKIYQNNDKGEKAVKVAEKLLNSDEPSIDNYYFVIQIQIQNGLYEKAISNLNAVENRIGINEGLSIEKFKLYIENNNLKKAEKELKTLVDNFPGNADYYVYLGDFYLDRKNFKEAFGQYMEASKVDPDNGKVHFSFANYYLNVKDTVNFRDQLFKAFESDNIDFNSKFSRFMPFVASRENEHNPLNNDEIEKVFEILIKKHPYETPIYGAYASFLVAEKKEEKAMQYFEKSLDIDASQPDVWQEYLFLLSSGHDNELLFDKANDAVTFFPNEPLFQLFKGVSLFQLGKVQKAAEVLENGLKLVEDNSALKARFHAYLGDIYHSLGNIEMCFSHYDSALEINENDIVVLNNYSYYLSLEGISLDKAEKMSARTVDLEPGNSTYLDTYAWVLFKKGRYSEAKFIIERAIDNMDKPSGVILEHYGDIMFKNGYVEKAVEQWKEALKYDDHSNVLQEKIQKEKFIDEKD